MAQRNLWPSAAEQEQVIQNVVHTDELAPRDRAAAILELVFAQQIERDDPLPEHCACVRARDHRPRVNR